MPLLLLLADVATADGVDFLGLVGVGLPTLSSFAVSTAAASGPNGGCRSSRGDSGEKDGKLVSDLSSDAAVISDDAELDGCDESLRCRLRTVDRCDFVDTADCCDTERSSGADVSFASMVPAEL